jgi:hypothetical protein
MTRYRGSLLAIAACAAFLFLPAPSHAQSRQSLIREDFAFPAIGPVRVVLFRPDVSVGEQSTGGLDQPSAAWSQQARDQLIVALGTAQGGRDIEMKPMPELSGNNVKLMANYRKLFKLVADSVIKHRLFNLDPLPTKQAVFDWTLGSGAAQLGVLGSADYGLFFYTADSYESASRRTVRLLTASVAPEKPTEVHMGYAGLIDLKTGDLVWINVDVKIAGDVRTASGAALRVAQLLRDFPRRAALAVVPPVKPNP